MKKILSAFLVLTSACASLQAQEYNGLWHKTPEGYTEQHGLPALKPERFSSFAASESVLKSYLSTIPQSYATARIIALPTPDGSYRSFRVWSTPAMEEGLAKKYPEITTYTAEAIDNGRITAKLDYTPFGFHAMVFDGAGTYLIDPYSGTADGAYIAYYKKDYKRSDGQYMVCELAEDESISGAGNSSNQQKLNGTVRKTYRLALACTGEYAIAVVGGIPTKPQVLAKMITSINRVNGVYEREVSVTLQLIANNDALIYLDGATDPYSNSQGGTMLGQNQSVVDGIIGNANYDIGHVFSTGGGGVATPGCVCNSGFKAGGVTGSANPKGDAFDIDFVAHEMGHQFSAKHTFNASTGNCAGNGMPDAAFEPGAGSTIMAYAGICGGADNFQAHSDAYFHSKSLEEISNFITSASGGCASSVTSTNANATMPAFAASYSIPILTPFELNAPAATDATADEITYCWEERDLGDFGNSLSATELQGPMFRSFPPDVVTSRVFITPFRLVGGATSYNAEKLPPKARAMNFRVTERDVYEGWGAFNFPDDVITLQVIQTTGPFTVTSPTASDVWTGGEHRTVTWDVVGTNAAPINCSTVDIYLSEDGGYTFPYLVKANTPNDGSESIIVPNPSTTSFARIKVKGHGNVFFNYSQGDFTVMHGTVGVENTSLADKVTVSPVPARETLQINAPASLGALQVRIVNTMGQAVWTGTVKDHSALLVASWARGIYYLHISGDKGLSTSRKIILE